MPANFTEQRHRISGTIYVLSQQSRSKITLSGIPRGVNRLFTIERVFTGHAFAPSFRPVSMNRQQKDAAFCSAAKTGLKKMDQRHMNLAQGDRFNFQVNSSEERRVGKECRSRWSPY